MTQLYLTSPEFLRLAPSTRRTYQLFIERMLQEEGIGHRQVAEMTREHVKRMMSKRASRPSVANGVMKKLRILINFAIDAGWRTDNPCLRMKLFQGGEIHTWTDEEIALFEARWPIGTAARTAFALLLCTGQRMGDVSHMAWHDVEDNAIRVVQAKTGTKLGIPLHPDLAEALAAWPPTHSRILTTSFGKGFSSKGFGQWMADRIGEAGVPEHCVTHGLRKAAARRLAEAGCSANEIAAITGHATLAEVTRYTKAAEQRTLAQSAIDRLMQRRSVQRVPNSSDEFGTSSEKLNKNNGEMPIWRSLRESNPSFQIENLTS